MMGAGNACSALYNTNVNLNTFGGSKKQGITSRIGLDNWANQAIQTKSNGYGRNKLFVMNQLGGVGQSMFNGRFTQVDGVNRDIEGSIARLEDLLRFYDNPSDPYQIALVGDRESFRKDLIAAKDPELASEAHDKIIHLVDAVFPSPNRDVINSLVAYLNTIIKQEIPYMERYGTHGLAWMPKKTGSILQERGYGRTQWHGLRFYAGSGFSYNVSDGVVYLIGALTSVFNGTVDQYLGTNVTVVQASAFADDYQPSGTLGLWYVTSIEASAFSGCKALTRIGSSNLTTIGASAFSGCEALTTLDLSNVASIGASAFSGCKVLTSIDLSNVASIGASAFSGCEGLTSVDLSNIAYATNSTSLPDIGDGAFAGCTNIISIFLPTIYSGKISDTFFSDMFSVSTYSAKIYYR
jgi:hypothetical protein